MDPITFFAEIEISDFYRKNPIFPIKNNKSDLESKLKKELDYKKQNKNDKNKK